MKNYLALFDLDGTLFDTGEVNYYAYKEALLEFGVVLDKNYYISECNGRHYTEFLPMIMGTDNNIDAVHKLKKEAYARNLNKARENVHLFKMIEVMKAVYYTAVVTTASRQNTSDILGYFGHQDLFEYIVTQENIAKVKPDPQGFLMAMDYFGMNADHTVIFEDSKVGIMAAKATGATVMVIKQF